MMRYLFYCIGILFGLQGYSHMLGNIPDSAYVLNYHLNNDTTGGYFYAYLDEKPYFKDKQDLVDWFNANVNYPDELLVHNLRMNYYLDVVADTLGRISLEKIACSIPKHNITGEVHPLLKDRIARRLDDEILKSMDTFPVCEPGRHRGQKRVVRFVLIFL